MAIISGMFHARKCQKFGLSEKGFNMDVSTIKAQSNDWIRQQAANMGIDLSAVDVANLKGMSYDKIAQEVVQLSLQQQQNIATFVTQPTKKAPSLQPSAQAQAIGRNEFTASRLAGALQCCPERWEEINKDAGLGLSQADMTRYWNMSTSEMTHVLMNMGLEQFSNITQATYGTDFGVAGSQLPQVIDGITPEGSKNRGSFPAYGMGGAGQNPLQIFSNAPNGFNPSYGRVVQASEYLAGLAKWGSVPHFDATAIAGGNGALPSIPSGIGTMITSNPSSITKSAAISANLAANYKSSQSVVGETVSQTA